MIGENPTLFGYVNDPLSEYDPFGLACAEVNNKGELVITNKFPKGSPEDIALQNHVADWNNQIQLSGGSMTRQSVSRQQRADANKAAAAARAQNPAAYPPGVAAGHTPDVAWGGTVQGPIIPLNSTVNGYISGVTQGVKPGTTYNKVVLR